MRTGWVIVAVALVACEGNAKQKASPPALSKAPLPEIVPEGAEMTLSPDAPVISTQSSGGFDGGDHGGIQIWADGSVRYTHGTCAKAPRLGRLPAARVTELLTALEKAGVYDAPLSLDKQPCCDCVSSSLTVRSDANHSRTLVDEGCDHDPGPAYKIAMKLVSDVVGTGPCGQ